ncbi:MAG: hypothetical protein J6Q58_00390 [Clostridia bacterium]|nr:hypothetical protein [Clostridia bacterium]
MEKKINSVLFFNMKDGRRLTFRVLFTYHSETFNKDYAVFYNEDDENHLIVYSYDEEYRYEEVKTQEENEELLKALHDYDAEVASQKNN